MSVIGTIVGRQKKESSRFDRQILTGMITNDEFLTGVLPIYKRNFQNPFANTVGDWVCEYYETYGKAPKADIEGIFREKKDFIQDQDEADIVEEFLLGLSNEYIQGDKFNSKYMLDKSEKYFREISLKNLIAEMQKTLLNGDTDEGEALIKGFDRVTLIKTQGVDPIFDESVIAKALSQETTDSLFSFPGAFGNLMGNLKRGWLACFIAHSGFGKTWFLMYTALKALLCGLNVLFISMEMSESQMVKRIQSFLTGLPEKRFAGKIEIPVLNCAKNKMGSCRKAGRDKYCKKCLGTKDFVFGTDFKTVIREELTVEKAQKKSHALRSAIRGNSFKLVTFPSRTATMNDIETYLYNLEHYENFIPDIIVHDYADKIKPDNERDQHRHQLAKIWEALKALAQKKNCLVVTASQKNRQGDWAESIEKLNLCDVCVDLYGTDIEKQKGYIKARVLKHRHIEFDTQKNVAVLQNLKIGKPYLDSAVLENKKQENKEGE